MSTTVLTGTFIRSGSIPTTALGGGVISSSTQITTALPGGTVSSSVQVKPLLPDGTVTSSAQYPGWVTSSAQIVVQNTTGIGALAITGSNTFIGNQIITGSLVLSGSALPELRVVGESVITGSLSVQGTISGNLVLPTNTVSSSTQVKAFLPGGTVTSSEQYPGWVTASSQIDYNSIQNKLSGVVSSSTQVAPLLPAGTVSSSLQYPGWVTSSGQISITETSGYSTFSSSIATKNDTQDISINALNAATSSYAINSTIQSQLAGVVSSSAQVKPLLPSGTVSSSAQYPGWVTASSQIVVQNTTGIAAIATTGSNTFIGNQTVTGSLFTSGSNTLIGNTRLTGSFGISGSEIVQGYMQFEPVTTNIDTSISASYIYVSGSTKDLYFSQNSAGYSNITRLRWLESNLYTGVLHGGIISSTIGSTTFNITSGSGIVVTMNASTGSAPYPTVRFVEWGQQTNIPITFSGSAKITYVGIDSNGNTVQQTVPWGSTDINQYDTQIHLGEVLHLSGSVSTGVYNSPQISYGGQQKTDDFLRAFGPLKISGHALQASGSSPTLSLKKTGGTAFLEGSNYANNPNHASTTIENDVTVSKIYRYHLSGSTPVINVGPTGSGYVAIDNTQYVDTTTGLLATVNSNNFTIQRVFWIPNSPTNAFIVYYGNAQYSSLLNAVNAKDSEPFVEAPDTANNAIFLGYIIVQGGTNPARDLLNPTYATIIPGGLFRSVGGVASSGTSPVATALASLSDVSISGQTAGDLLVYTGATWNNTKALNGNYTLTGSLATNGGITAVTINATSISSSLSGSGAGVFGVNYNTLSNIPSGIVSSSTQVKTLLPGGTVSSSTQFNTLTDPFSGSFSGSFNGRYTGSILSPGVVSSSAQYPGWVTASSQIDYNSITNKLSGVYSSSVQTVASLSGQAVTFSGSQFSGIVSGSGLQYRLVVPVGTNYYAT